MLSRVVERDGAQRDAGPRGSPGAGWQGSRRCGPGRRGALGPCMLSTVCGGGGEGGVRTPLESTGGGGGGVSPRGDTERRAPVRGVCIFLKRAQLHTRSAFDRSQRILGVRRQTAVAKETCQRSAASFPCEHRANPRPSVACKLLGCWVPE